MQSFTEAGPVRRAVRVAVTSRPLARLSARYLHRLDRAVLAATRGRGTLSGWVSGLPVVVLTTTGARSGLARSTPVLGLPDGDGLVVIGANFGGPQHPAWCHNLRAHPGATVTVRGRERRVTARELTGEDREGQFDRAVLLNPGWLRFRERAGRRSIPVFRLEPERV